MVRSCSITTTWPGRSGNGATYRSTNRSPGLRGVDEIDPVFVDGRAAVAHLIDQRQQRAAERHQVAQHVPAQQRDRDFEEGFGGDIGVGDLAVGAITITGCGSALSTASAPLRDEVPARACMRGPQARLMRRPVHGEGGDKHRCKQRASAAALPRSAPAARQRLDRQPRAAPTRSPATSSAQPRCLRACRRPISTP